MSWNQPSPSARHALLAAALVPVVYVAFFGPALVLNQRLDFTRPAFDRGYVTVFKRMPVPVRNALLNYGALWLRATETPPLLAVSDRVHTYRYYDTTAGHSAIATPQ